MYSTPITGYEKHKGKHYYFFKSITPQYAIALHQSNKILQTLNSQEINDLIFDYFNTNYNKKEMPHFPFLQSCVANHEIDNAILKPNAEFLNAKKKRNINRMVSTLLIAAIILTVFSMIVITINFTFPLSIPVLCFTALACFLHKKFYRTLHILEKVSLLCYSKQKNQSLEIFEKNRLTAYEIQSIIAADPQDSHSSYDRINQMSSVNQTQFESKHTSANEVMRLQDKQNITPYESPEIPVTVTVTLRS